jgi:hypothetical protein
MKEQICSSRFVDLDEHKIRDKNVVYVEIPDHRSRTLRLRIRPLDNYFFTNRKKYRHSHSLLRELCIA